MSEATEITLMNTRGAVAFVAGAATIEDLDRLQAAERDNPKVAGGRVRVLEAIDVRRGELGPSALSYDDPAAPTGRFESAAAASATSAGEKDDPPPPMDLSPDAPWREDRWAELPQFNCRSCPYQTLEGRQAIEQHVAAAHPPVWRSYLKTREA